eukprot:15437619-Alexandrium_andersonii.AAC.1
MFLGRSSEVLGAFPGRSRDSRDVPWILPGRSRDAPGTLLGRSWDSAVAPSTLERIFGEKC